MCEIATALMGISAAVGGASALSGGAAAKSQAASEAALYRAQAAMRLEKAKYDTEVAQRNFSRKEGTVDAQIGTTGIMAGSFSDVKADDAEEASLERQAIRWSSQNEANMLEYQANAAERRGSDAQTASYFGAASAVVGAFGPMIKSRYGNSSGSSGVSVGGSDSGFTGFLK